MIKIFKKFFRFSGEHRRAWYLSVVLEFLRCIAEAIQFFPLFLVLLHLVDGTMTPAVAWTALGLVALSVALQAVLHYFSHKLEMRACYLMLDDKRISIGERMKYMPMGYFNDRSLGNLTAICTSTMEDLESMAGAIVVRILAGVLHALVFSLGFMIIDWRIGLIFLAGVVAMLLVNSRMLAMSRKYSPERLAAQMRLVDAVLEYIQGMSVIKAFSLSGRAGTSIEDTIDETERQNFKLEKKSIPYTIAQQVVLRLFAVAAIAASIVFFLGGTMSLFVRLLMVIGGFLVYGQLEGPGSLSFMLPMVRRPSIAWREADSAPYMDERGTVRNAPGALDRSLRIASLLRRAHGDRRRVAEHPRAHQLRHRGAVRVGQDHAREPYGPLLGRGRGHGVAGRRGRARLEARRAHGALRHGVPGRLPVQRHH